MPTIKPAKPIPHMKTVLNTRTALESPAVEYHRAQHSKNAGIARPSIDSAKAPKSEMNSPKFGIATANKTKL